jgi:hypothetical protein
MGFNMTFNSILAIGGANHALGLLHDVGTVLSQLRSKDANALGKGSLHIGADAACLSSSWHARRLPVRL